MTSMFWRNADVDTSSLDALLGSLAVLPTDPRLRPAPEAIDLAVLRRISDDPAVLDRAQDAPAVARLWDVCGLPDFGKAGVDHHGRSIVRLWSQLVSGNRHIDPIWFEGQIKRLDVSDGDVDAIAARIATCRTLCYIAHRDDWLTDAAGWAERTRQLETRLSDALHDALTQRFVNRRTTVLLRDLGRGAAALPVQVAADGAVAVDGERIGTLDGFRFRVDPSASAADQRLLRAAAERHLRGYLATKADALVAADDHAFGANPDADGTIPLLWSGHRVAHILCGRRWRQPGMRLDPALMTLDPARTAAVRARLERWLATRLSRDLKPLIAIEAARDDAATPAPLRTLLAALADQGGRADRATVQPLLAALDPPQRGMLARLGITVGSLDLYHPALLKPAPTLWRTALMAVAAHDTNAVPPPPSIVCMNDRAPGKEAMLTRAGFRRLGAQWLRIDMIERLARQAHAARLASEAVVTVPAHAQASAADEGTDYLPLPGFAIDAALATSLGLDAAAHRALLLLLGFKPAGATEANRWRWAGLSHRQKRGPANPKAKAEAQAKRVPGGTAKTKGPYNPARTAPKPAVVNRHSPFAGLDRMMAAAATGKNP
jgi:ATP-dependent RNA helicase SUPV3L1/SUV3